VADLGHVAIGRSNTGSCFELLPNMLFTLQVSNETGLHSYDALFNYAMMVCHLLVRLRSYWPGTKGQHFELPIMKAFLKPQKSSGQIETHCILGRRPIKWPWQLGKKALERVGAFHSQSQPSLQLGML